MNRPQFFEQCLAIIQDFFRKILVHSAPFKIFIGFSHLYQNFTLSFFYDKIWKGYLTNMEKSFSTTLPSIDSFSTIFCKLSRGIFSLKASKMRENPFNQYFVCRRDTNVSLIVFISVFLILTVVSDGKTTFAIQNSSHISTHGNRIFLKDIVTFSQTNPLFNGYSNVNYTGNDDLLAA